MLVLEMLKLSQDKNMQEKILFSSDVCVENISAREVFSTRIISDNLEDICKKKWLELRQKAEENNSKIWDSEIYRFENLVGNKDKIILNVSTLPFSIRLAMNFFTKEIMELGEEYKPMGMFFSCFLKTSDGFYVFVEKSKKLYAERIIYFIGGVLSKTEIDLTRKSLSEAVILEIEEEVGVVFRAGEIYLKSIYVNENLNCCLLFLVETKKTKEELENSFKSKDGEVAKLKFVHSGQLKEFVKNLPSKDAIKFVIAKIYE